jgi:hypothetical protein
VFASLFGLSIGQGQAMADEVFPAVAVGDSFSGNFSINPLAPVTNHPYGPNSFVYSTDSGQNVGALFLTLNGGTFSSPVDLVEAEAGSTAGSFWSIDALGQVNPTGNTSPAAFNSSPIPFFQAILTLPGAASTTSILPLTYSSYNPDDPSDLFQGPSLQLAAIQRDGTVEILALGTLLSLNEVGTTPDYSFTGEVTSITTEVVTEGIGYVPPDATPPPGAPEPSTWAMLLIGFAGIGFAGWRKSHPALA